MRYSSVLNANSRFFCSENRNFTLKNHVNLRTDMAFLAFLRLFDLKTYEISDLEQLVLDL